MRRTHAFKVLARGKLREGDGFGASCWPAEYGWLHFFCRGWGGLCEGEKKSCWVRGGIGPLRGIKALEELWVIYFLILIYTEHLCSRFVFSLFFFDTRYSIDGVKINGGNWFCTYNNVQIHRSRRLSLRTDSLNDSAMWIYPSEHPALHGPIQHHRHPPPIEWISLRVEAISVRCIISLLFKTLHSLFVVQSKETFFLVRSRLFQSC